MTHVYYVNGEVRYYEPPDSNLSEWLAAYDRHGYRHLPRHPRVTLAGHLRFIREEFGREAAAEFLWRIKDQQSHPEKVNEQTQEG